MELKWITLATFSDASLYHYRWFRDDSVCGLEYRKHSTNTKGGPRGARLEENHE